MLRFIIVIIIFIILLVYIPTQKTIKHIKTKVSENDFDAVYNFKFKKYNFSLPIDPGKSYISSPYGERPNPFDKTKTQFHKGVDYGTYNKHIEVYAVEPSEVIQADQHNTAGKYIILKGQKTNLYYIYKHLSKIFVSKSQKIKQKHIIGLTGSTGRTTGIHLHFEIRTTPEPSSHIPPPSTFTQPYKNK